MPVGVALNAIIAGFGTKSSNETSRVQSKLKTEHSLPPPPASFSVSEVVQELKSKAGMALPIGPIDPWVKQHQPEFDIDALAKRNAEVRKNRAVRLAKEEINRGKR